MADEGGGIIGALCALCCFSNLQAWCDQKAFGGNGCCGQRGQAGCCNSCCDDAFNEDSFDKPKKGQNRIASEPAATEGMKAPSATPAPGKTAAEVGQ